MMCFVVIVVMNVQINVECWLFNMERPDCMYRCIITEHGNIRSQIRSGEWAYCEPWTMTITNV